MRTGTVKWFNNQKGYGFIIDDTDGKEYFAHFTKIAMDGYKTLQEGQKVSYDIEQGLRGDQAANITVVE